MEKNWKALILSGAMALALCSCAAGDGAHDVIATILPSETAEPIQSAAPEHTWKVSPTHTPIPEPTPTPFFSAADKAYFFHRIPQQFSFLSGAGGWSTELYLTGGDSYDGSFTGQYHDSNMGEEGEGYQGSVYYCNFTGKFTQPERLEEFVYSVTLEDLAYEAPEAESIEDGVRYITAGPYGLENAGELRIYFPGYPIKNIPEEDRVWLLSAPELAPYTFDEMVEMVLPDNTYLIHNVNEGQLFFGSLPSVTLYDDVSGLVEPG